MVSRLPTGGAPRELLLLRPRMRLFDCAKDLDSNRLGLPAMTISTAKHPIRFRSLTRMSRLFLPALIFVAVRVRFTLFLPIRSMFGTVLQRPGSTFLDQPSALFWTQAGAPTPKKRLESILESELAYFPLSMPLTTKAFAIKARQWDGSA